MMKTALAAAALLGLALGGSCCCLVKDSLYYATDRTLEDCRQAATIPQAIGDGVARDLDVYRLVRSEGLPDESRLPR